jgi:hypothetical protein
MHSKLGALAMTALGQGNLVGGGVRLTSCCHLLALNERRHWRAQRPLNLMFGRGARGGSFHRVGENNRLASSGLHGNGFRTARTCNNVPLLSEIK